MKHLLILFSIGLLATTGCTKEHSGGDNGLRYYRVAMKTPRAEWRDTSFIVATSKATLIGEIETQLTKPVNERKMVNGRLRHGNAGYNVNASHSFLWHFDENDWHLADFTAEVYDGRPYTDVDQDTAYWIGNLGRFAPWSSYIAEEITR